MQKHVAQVKYQEMVQDQVKNFDEQVSNAVIHPALGLIRRLW